MKCKKKENLENTFRNYFGLTFESGKKQDGDSQWVKYGNYDGESADKLNAVIYTLHTQDHATMNQFFCGFW